jgi:hypothetical protein
MRLASSCETKEIARSTQRLRDRSPKVGWFQGVDATLACSLSAGVLNPKVCRGRAAPTENGYAQLAPSEESLNKSADGRMSTEAEQLKPEKLREERTKPS